MTPIVKIAAFMKKRIKALKYMHREDLLYWLMWHDKRGSLAYHIEDGRIQAAGVARPIKDPDSCLDYYQFDEGSETVKADQAASINAKTFATLIQTMAKRFPYAKTFMYKNCKTGRVRSCNLSRFNIVTSNLGRIG